MSLKNNIKKMQKRKSSKNCFLDDFLLIGLLWFIKNN